MKKIILILAILFADIVSAKDIHCYYYGEIIVSKKEVFSYEITKDYHIIKIVSFGKKLVTKVPINDNIICIIDEYQIED